MICYEHPLNERIRTLLRLEDLFNKVAFFADKENAVEHHSALVILFEILDVANRADMKPDLLQELERQKKALESLRKNPDVSQETLNQVLNDIQVASHGMLGIVGKVGEHLREDEWLMGIKQRTGIPGGACEFDLPSYHYWLHLDPAICRKHLNEWIAPLLPIRDSFRIILHLLRNSGRTFQHIAHRGMFQQMGQGCAAHMLCLKVSEDLPCVPEISANKYALTIRFVTSGSGQKTKVYENDVEFQLAFCTL
ncbi:MAG: cell division protein ZapD [Betaproteobacteria bacterium]|nr:MAG: cell division protein ZapD [Betaproteobacteria bacterium]